MRAVGGFDVRALVDRREDRARAGAESAKVPRHIEATSPIELDSISDLDAITCGTAPFAHHEIVRGALDSGLHVITEKPFTMTVEQGQELAALAAQRALVLCVVHNFQFARSVRQLKRWISSGRVGRPRAIWATQFSNPLRRLPEWYEELPLGLFYDEAPHLIYLVRDLAPEPLERIGVTVYPSTIGKVTPAQIGMRLRSGDVPVMLEMNFEAPVSEWQVAVLGEEGLGVVDVFRDIALFARNDGSHNTMNVVRTSASLGTGHIAGYLRSGPKHLTGRLDYGNREVFRRFRNAIQRGEPAVGISAEDAVEVLRLQHWVIESAG